ncbi:MAG: helix-turn-helix domain-containing protein [Deltaproteobacteria bacterium]|nr:helix-turn-helix domain-containing protein [Deltaproteobacteria bacterium]MBI3078666.1 helix-turn-helix domain-containing protein [Deltaproteobacteria bacterium]
MLKIKDAARYLNVSASTIWRWVRTGKVPSVRLGGIRRIRRSDLEKLAAEDLRLEAKPPRVGDFPVLTRKSGLFRLVGIGDSGFPGIAQDHHRYLAEQKS